MCNAAAAVAKRPPAQRHIWPCCRRHGVRGPHPSPVDSRPFRHKPKCQTLHSISQYVSATEAFPSKVPPCEASSFPIPIIKALPPLHSSLPMSPHFLLTFRDDNSDPFFYHRLLSKEGFCSTHSAHQTKFSSGTISTGSSGETVNVGIRAIQLEHTRDLVFAGPISSLSTVPRQGQGAGTKSKTFGVCASDICTKYEGRTRARKFKSRESLRLQSFDRTYVAETKVWICRFDSSRTHFRFLVRLEVSDRHV